MYDANPHYPDQQAAPEQLEVTEQTFSKAEAKQYRAYTQGGTQAKSKRKTSSVGKKASRSSKTSRKTRTR